MRTRTRNRLVAETVSKNRLVALGLAVIEAREQKGMSARELAEASGIPLRSLERIEAGEPDPDADATTDKTTLDPDLIALGRMVRAARERKGMSVAELAEAAGYKRRRLVRIEAGELDPRYDGLIALADGLGLRVAALMPPDASMADR
ncbi:MAG TPA: helix-turn-helix transcriptional regulator [Solirubrobacteraceae bacterium]|nr:helix-turn-helix transcriptional regulator [Solirubrobacteraceae bacterium]